MAFAVLQCLEPSEFFPTKTLKLEEGVPQILGKSAGPSYVSSVNGLFEEKCRNICYQHALLVYVNKKFFLEDKSTNGTYLNGNRIHKNCKYIIVSGDVIQLGGESFSMTVDFNLITFSVKLFTHEDADFSNIFLLKETYVTPLQLYKNIPTFECTLTLLHESVINRLEALKILDTLGNINYLTETLVDWILNKFRENNLCHLIKLILGTSCSYEEEYNIQKMDHISHFILCIASCRSYAMKKWFLEQEKKLLLLRWKFLTGHEKLSVVSEYFRCFKEVTVSKKMQAANSSNGIVDSSQLYFNVFFTDISELIARRIIYMSKGSCYVSLNDLIYAITSDFTKYLIFNLENIKKNLHKVWNDERIISIISYVEKEVQIERFLFGKSSNVMLKEIDLLADESFPLCMSVLHFHLKKNNHLKNSGRFQYGLFLKGIGLSLQDSQTFWRHYFTKRMSLNEFIKCYAYQIYHLYGAIGKKADYPPQSCKKIFQAVPTFSEYHGCPFKLLDEENISSLLRKDNVNTEVSVQQVLRN